MPKIGSETFRNISLYKKKKESPKTNFTNCQTFQLLQRDLTSTLVWKSCFKMDRHWVPQKKLKIDSNQVNFWKIGKSSEKSYSKTLWKVLLQLVPIKSNLLSLQFIPMFIALAMLDSLHSRKKWHNVFCI